ncbi:alpha/beta fold hydrolase [Kiloniella majae]|uniref:alpha/beta fold hydrolase n=1 Tax=Kiloniella majae TaxID=1938558 RepID=UPI000A279483|nr:alpha/beta hydrolase [Kiloniella majae]
MSNKDTAPNSDTEFTAQVPEFLERPNGQHIAYIKTEGDNDLPGIVFLGGYMSDMTGSKATTLEEFAKSSKQNFVRFDYMGHGQSSGKFTEGTIGQWTEDAIAVIDELTTGPQILVGSSMGGWIMLNTALKRPDRTKGLVGIAAAPDFTQDLMWDTFSQEIKNTLLSDGVYYEPSQYGDAPYAITLKLIEEGRQHLLLDKKQPITCPVRLIQGMQDVDVPWDIVPRIVESLETEDMEVVLVKSGDHRLSEPQDLQRLKKIIKEISR